MSTIGERIRLLRGKQTLDEFSKKNGIHRVTLSRLEKGERTPDATFLQLVVQNTGVRSEWILMGAGQMYPEGTSAEDRTAHEVSEKVSDMSDVIDSSDSTHPNKNRELYENKMSDMSDIQGLQRELLDSFREQNRLVRENAELQVTLARARMDTERREQRIRELERENAQLREAQKGAPCLYCSHTGDAG